MCLAVPGQLVKIKKDGSDDISATGTVDFQGSRIEVGLALTPEAAVGDWVLVHAGYALNVLDEQEARETWEYLQLEEEVRQAEQADETSAG